MRVLLIEDDIAIARSIELALRSEGLNVYATNLGEQGIDLGKLHDYYDIIILDLFLPDMSGFDVLEAFGAAKVRTPILILSGDAMIEAKVKALGFGADDYMTKPFHKDELVARIGALARRSKRSKLSGRENSVVQFARRAGIAMGATYIKTEWETGYMLRDRDCGQVVVA